MINYTGVRCPVCDRPFTEHDDIVVCPECGAPYHRACYEKAGKCVFEEKHGTGEGWKPPKVEAPHSDEEEKTKKCPRCGKLNAQSALFCDQCGQSLIGNTAPPHSYPNQDAGPQRPGGYTYGGYQGGPVNGPMGDQPQGPMGGGYGPMGGPGQIPVMFDPMGGVAPTELIDDVPAGDVAKLVQNNTPYYMPVFMNLKRFHRNRFNFCAFLFSGGWMLYRKMYKPGIIFTAITLVLYLTNLVVTNNFYVPLMQELMKDAGITADSVGSIYEQSMQISQLLYSRPPLEIFLFCLPLIISVLQLCIALIAGFNGNKFYCKHCLGKVRKIHADYTTAAEFDTQLHAQGGVNTSLAICLLICYMLVMYVPMLFF